MKPYLNSVFNVCNSLILLILISISLHLSPSFSTQFFFSVQQLTDKSSETIARFLRTNQSLQILSISYNKFGDEGIVKIVEALDFNTSLKTLDILCNFSFPFPFLFPTLFVFLTLFPLPLKIMKTMEFVSLLSATFSPTLPTPYSNRFPSTTATPQTFLPSVLFFEKIFVIPGKTSASSPLDNFGN
jgi:hypothetical protein